jgi:hypothetical protein
MTDKKPTVLNEGESFNARRAMMQAKREAPPPPKPVTPPAHKK